MKSIKEMTSVVFANTIRLQKTETGYIEIGLSSNRGLECYLGEAFCRAFHKEQNIEVELLEVAARVLSESVYFGPYKMWRWERQPSIADICYPFDWDDTSKAVDFLLTTLSRTNDPTIKNWCQDLPEEDFWEEQLRYSLFNSETIGVDTTLDCQHSVTLSVFFGPGIQNTRPRDDPMVTVATVRSTGLWFPTVADHMQKEFRELLCRASFVLNICLKKNVSFSKFSRYYFSLGHYAFRLIETVLNFGLPFSEVGLSKNQLIEQIEKVECLAQQKNINNEDRKEVIWWLLIGILLGKISVEQVSSLFYPLDMTNLDIVYQHRSKAHLYGTRGWVSRLQLWEFKCLGGKIL